MIKWGIIGCGGIARRRMIPAIKECKYTELVAVMDTNREATDEVAKETNTKAYYTEEDLLNDKDVQAVYIATPVFLHHDQVIKAAKAGKHILLEKPLSMTLEQGQAIVDACADAGVLLAEGYMMKFHALNKKAKEIVESGAIGNVVSTRAQLMCWYPDIPGAWRQNPELGGGGSLFDMATHCYDLLEYVIGSKISEVSAMTDTLTFKYPVEDSSTTLLRFESGAMGSVDAFFNIPDNAGYSRLEIYGNKGSILAEGTIGQMPVGKMLLSSNEQAAGYNAQQEKASLDVSAKEVEFTPVNMYACEIDEMSKCIENGTKPTMSSGEDGMHIMRVAKAAYESANTGKRVKV